MANDRVGRWYFGGLAGSCAACFTHPLDLMKVLLQTQQSGKVTMPQLAVQIARNDGIAGFYSGLSASILRQATYTLGRFGVYETAKKHMMADSKNSSFSQKLALAGLSGAFGGLVGSPADLVNVRMQNDVKLPYEQRRHYRNAIDGLFRIAREERFSALFNGATMAIIRGVFMTIGQLAFYDQIKETLVRKELMKDNVYTHLFSSFLAASAATVLTQPVDVLKTRMMNAKPGEFKGVVDCFVFTARTGPSAFFKGFVPAFVRLAPHTILLFVFFEQFRMRFGYLRPQENKLTH